MVIVGILQNQWFKNPEYFRGVYAKDPSLDHRAKLNRRYLFFRCQTGKRLEKYFGERCDEIIWENASTFIGGKSDSKAEHDPLHLERLWSHWKPNLVLAFGKVATSGVIATYNGTILHGPHPAARQAGVKEALETMANMLEERIAYFENGGPTLKQCKNKFDNSGKVEPPNAK